MGDAVTTQRKKGARQTQDRWTIPRQQGVKRVKKSDLDRWSIRKDLKKKR